MRKFSHFFCPKFLAFFDSYYKKGYKKSLLGCKEGLIGDYLSEFSYLPEALG